jgi:hypothetical protein
MQWYSPVAFHKCVHRSLIRSWHISWGSRCNCGEAEGKGGAWARWAGSEPVGWVLACCCSPVGWGGCRNAAPMSDSSAPWCLKPPSRIPLHTLNFKIWQNLTKTSLLARLSENDSWTNFATENKLKSSNTTSDLLVQLSPFPRLRWCLPRQTATLSVHKNLENLLTTRNTKPSSQTTAHQTRHLVDETRGPAGMGWWIQESSTSPKKKTLQTCSARASLDCGERRERREKQWIVRDCWGIDEFKYPSDDVAHPEGMSELSSLYSSA